MVVDLLQSRAMSTASGLINLPRILCLHGGGTSGRIFQAQFRAFLNHEKLKNRFRFVFVDAPFVCDAGPGIFPVYSDWGPFRRWFRWSKSQPAIDNVACINEIVHAVKQGMTADQGTGPWVGVAGFSQGAKLAASMLYQQQLAGRSGDWKVGLILAARAPLVALSEQTCSLPWMQPTGGLGEDADLESILERPEMKLMIPTVQVRGSKDVGLSLQRTMVDNYSAPGMTVAVDWDGHHRVPVKTADVDKVVDAFVEMCDEYGV